jgi:hypothetical protein
VRFSPYLRAPLGGTDLAHDVATMTSDPANKNTLCVIGHAVANHDPFIDKKFTEQTSRFYWLSPQGGHKLKCHLFHYRAPS